MFLPGKSPWSHSTYQETGRGPRFHLQGTLLNKVCNSNFSRIQTDITVNMRTALLAWLVGISRLMELSLETW